MLRSFFKNVYGARFLRAEITNRDGLQSVRSRLDEARANLNMPFLVPLKLIRRCILELYFSDFALSYFYFHFSIDAWYNLHTSLQLCSSLALSFTAVCLSYLHPCKRPAHFSLLRSMRLALL